MGKNVIPLGCRNAWLACSFKLRLIAVQFEELKAWYSFHFNTSHVVLGEMPDFFKTISGLQEMPYKLLKDQVGIQNTATLCRCNNDIIIALKK